MTSRTLPWLAVAVLLSGCFGGFRGRAEPDAMRATSTAPAVSTAARFGADDDTPAATPRAARVAVTRSSDAPDYRLAPRDQVVFEMFNEPDVKTTQRLSSQGEMTLPLIGAVTLAGRTLREAEQEIRGRYVKGGFYVDPHVILSVAEYGAHFVTVLGQVNRPDRIELPIEAASVGLVEAITQAGGFTRFARADAVQVTRQTGAGTERHFTIDLRGFFGQRGPGDRDEFQLQPGDVVFVPERLF